MSSESAKNEKTRNSRVNMGLVFMEKIHRILRGPLLDSRTETGTDLRFINKPDVVRALLASSLSGGMVVLVSTAFFWLFGDQSLPAPWAQLLRPELASAACVAALLFLYRGNSNHRFWNLAAALVAGVIPFAAGEVFLSLGHPPLPYTFHLGLGAAVLCALLVSPGSRTIQISQARLASIQVAGDGILVVDQTGRLLHANRAACTTLKLAPVPLWPAPPAMAPNAIQGILEDPNHRCERLKSTSGRFFEAWTTALEQSGPLHCVRGVLIRDVTTRRLNERKLVHLAHYDSLTELANRRLFLEMMAQTLKAARVDERTVALFYIDLDHFKSINDTLGHAAGDSMLQTVADRFRNHLRDEDLSELRLDDSGEICIARLAGDEFAVVIPHVKDSESTKTIGQTILSLISKPMDLADRTLTSSGSIGVAVFPQDGNEVEELIHNADAALYVAKKRGRGRIVCFEKSFEDRSCREQLIEDGLRQAIGKGELALHYQPKVDLESGTVAGFEALLRWTSDSLGTIGPSEFIPVAEDRGLICELGSWCLEQTCHQLRMWQDEDLVVVPISVNVSSVQFSETDLQRVVGEALKNHRIDPQLLELELTETLLLEEGDQTELTIRDLRAFGIHFALDDFGTGYSALTYLNRFQLDVLKMDRALLREISSNGSAEGIAAAVVSMAHSLGLTVVAEGIDMESQLEPLRRMKCDQIQGFLYAPALPPEEAYRYLARKGERPPIAQIRAGAAEVTQSSSQTTSSPDPDEMLPVLKQGTHDSTATGATSKENVVVSSDTYGRVLVVDDEEGSLGPVALRMGRLGIDLHYASAADEAELFIRQEKDLIRLIATSPALDFEVVSEILESLSKVIGSQPPFVVLGEEPDEAHLERIRAAGASMVLWAPFEDSELRFLVKCAMSIPGYVSERKEARYPVNIMVNIRTGSRREVALVSGLSQRGAFIETSDLYETGVQLQVEFELTNDRFRGFARVVYQQPGDPEYPARPTGIGVVFFGSDREAERMLREEAQIRGARYLP